MEKSLLQKKIAWETWADVLSIVKDVISENTKEANEYKRSE